jgi:hypothetical protein
MSILFKLTYNGVNFNYDKNPFIIFYLTFVIKIILITQ